jgi:hypothetical protein
MKIGIIGSGIVGQVLGKSFLSEGHEVMLGTRTPYKIEVVKWKDENQTGRSGTLEDTATFGELIVLATMGEAAENAIRLAGLKNFSGKTVIDVTNPIDNSALPDNGVIRFFTGPNESLMEKIQALLPDAHIVKAFNSVGNTMMYKPKYTEGKPSMFICGNNAEAKKTTEQILESFGWETEDMGSVEAARAIEPLCILWCIPGFIRNQWTHAFKLLKK